MTFEEHFKSLIENGLRDFYEGSLAKRILSDLSKTSSPLVKEDFVDYEASFT